MSINDDNLDDLDQNQAIHTPDLIQQTNEPITIIPQVPENQNQTTELTDELADKLTKMDVTFKLVEDGISKVIDMKEVEADILGDEAMDRAKAEDVQAAFESFLTPTLRLNEFTSHPSQTNLAFTKRFMATKIANEQHAVSDSAKQLVEEVEGLLIYIKDDCKTNILEQVEEVRSESTVLYNKLKDSKNTVLAVDNRFINIYVADLINEKEDLSKAVYQAFNINLDNSLDVIEDLFKDINFKCFILCMAYGNSIEDIYDNNTKAKYSQQNISACTIVSALASTNLISYMDYCTETISYICKELETIKANIADICEDYSKVVQYINENAKTLKAYTCKLKCIYESFKSLKRLINVKGQLYSTLIQL